MNHCRKNFTLVEILAVSVIVAILAAIGFGSYSYARDKARDSSCRALIKQLEAGLENFKVKYGYYPPSKGEFVNIVVDNAHYVPERWVISFGTGSDNFSIGTTSAPPAANDNTANAKKNRNKAAQLKALIGNMDIESFKNTVTADSDSDVDNKGNITKGSVKDPWGGRIYYRSPGLVNRGSFDLIAAGPDGILVCNDKFATSDTIDLDGSTSRDAFLAKFRDSSGEWLCDDITNF